MRLYTVGVSQSPDSDTQTPRPAASDLSRRRRPASPVETGRRTAWGKEWGKVAQEAAKRARGETT